MYRFPSIKEARHTGGPLRRLVGFGAGFWKARITRVTHLALIFNSVAGGRSPTRSRGSIHPRDPRRSASRQQPPSARIRAGALVALAAFPLDEGKSAASRGSGSGSAASSASGPTTTAASHAGAGEPSRRSGKRSSASTSSRRATPAAAARGAHQRRRRVASGAMPSIAFMRAPRRRAVVHDELRAARAHGRARPRRAGRRRRRRVGEHVVERDDAALLAEHVRAPPLVEDHVPAAAQHALPVGALREEQVERGGVAHERERAGDEVVAVPAHDVARRAAGERAFAAPQRRGARRGRRRARRRRTSPEPKPATTSGSSWPSSG